LETLDIIQEEVQGGLRKFKGATIPTGRKENSFWLEIRKYQAKE